MVWVVVMDGGRCWGIGRYREATKRCRTLTRYTQPQQLYTDGNLLMHDTNAVIEVIDELCASIQHFKLHCLPHATYTAPIIDYFNPDDYSQLSIAGLSKFIARVEVERENVRAVCRSLLLYRSILILRS